MVPFKNCRRFAVFALAIGFVACRAEEPVEPVRPVISALENPIAECEAQLAMCQGAGRLGCADEMRACLTGFAEWLRAI